MLQSHYTTGQIAALLKVTGRTVSRLIDSGQLPGYRIPGGDRRVARVALLRFMRLNKIPVADATAEEAPVVLLAGFPDAFGRALTPLLADWDVRAAEGAFWAGVLMARAKPDVMVLDATALGGPSACEIAAAAAVCGAAVIVRATADGGEAGWEERGWVGLAADAGPEDVAGAVRMGVRR